MEEKASILIVDDYEGIRRNLSLILGKMGHETEEAGTACEAIEKAQNKFFNVALLDIMLPDCDGVELLASLKRMHPDMAVVMITGHASMETAVRALNEGASAYITKPLDMDRVVATVREALGRQWLVNENRRLYEEAQRELAERRKVEEALRRSEERYRFLYEGGPAISLIMGTDGAIRDACKASLEKLGYAREDIVNRSALDFVVPEHHERAAAMLARCFNDEYTPEIDLDVYANDGSVRTILFSPGQLVLREGDEPSGILVTGIDITERKRLEQLAARQSAVVEAINRVFREALVCETEEELAKTCLAVAEQLTGSMFGWIGEVNAKWRLDTIVISDPGRGECGMPGSEAARAMRNMPIRGLWGTVIRKGRSLIVNDPASHPDRVGVPEGYPPLTSFLGVPLRRGSAIFGEIALANKRSGYLPEDVETVEALSVAIVESLLSKRAREALRQSEEKLRLMFESVTDGMVVTDLKGVITDVNPGAMRMHGFGGRDEIVGKFAFDLVAPRDRRRARTNVRAAMRKGTVADAEFTLCRVDRSEFPAELGASVLNDASGEPVGLVTVLRDITERRQAEERLRDYRQQLRSLASRLSLAEERERRRLAAGLHDRVGQTLAVIKLKLGALQEPLPPAELERQLGEVRAHVDQVIKETRSLTFELSPPVLYELGLEAALEWLAEQSQERHGVPCKLKDDGRAKPLGDDMRGILFGAANELLLNVAKHAQARAARISVGRRGDEVRVTVEDNGVGFDLSEMGRPTRGFGLFSIRERLEQVGGRVEVKSRPGRGTRVVVVAPIEREAKAEEGDSNER